MLLVADPEARGGYPNCVHSRYVARYGAAASEVTFAVGAAADGVTTLRVTRGGVTAHAEVPQCRPVPPPRITAHRFPKRIPRRHLRRFRCRVATEALWHLSQAEACLHHLDVLHDGTEPGCDSSSSGSYSDTGEDGGGDGILV
eukprot:gene1796-biopygen6450